MKIDFKRPLLDLNGDALKGEDQPLVLGTIAVNALMGTYSDEQNLSGGEKIHRYNLAVKIYAANAPLELNVEDIALCKMLIGKGFTTLIAGQAIPMLEVNAGN